MHRDTLLQTKTVYMILIRYADMSLPTGLTKDWRDGLRFLRRLTQLYEHTDTTDRESSEPGSCCGSNLERRE